MSEIKQCSDPSIKIGDTVDISNIQKLSRLNRLNHGWVKCSERLPKEGDMVLTFNSHHIHIGFTYYESDPEENYAGYFWRDETDDYEIENVTHWQPLPPLPENENE